MIALTFIAGVTLGAGVTALLLGAVVHTYEQTPATMRQLEKRVPEGHVERVERHGDYDELVVYTGLIDRPDGRLVPYDLDQ